MPRITDERREARRDQVLEAARACLEEHGLEAVSMEMIIARSGLSTGAVYGYFKGKDQIINAVISDGTAAMAEDLAPIFLNPDPPPLPEFMNQVLNTMVNFGRHKKGGIDRLLVSLHGLSLIHICAATNRKSQSAQVRRSTPRTKMPPSTADLDTSLGRARR